MEALGIIAITSLICWLVCGWHFVIGWFKSLYTHGWRYEMRKARDEAAQIWKDAFSLGEDDE